MYTGQCGNHFVDFLSLSTMLQNLLYAPCLIIWQTMVLISGQMCNLMQNDEIYAEHWWIAYVHTGVHVWILHYGAIRPNKRWWSSL